MRIPELVAHRGYMLRYPENTLLGLQAAIECGAQFIEFDVHLSQDMVPVVAHDFDLLRTAGRPDQICDMTADQLTSVIANEPQRFGDLFPDARIPRLEEVVQLIAMNVNVLAFVELKRRSLDHFGCILVVERVLACLQLVIDRCVLISFSLPAIVAARNAGAVQIGWVMEEYTEASLERARELNPDYLFVDHDLLPAEGRLQPGSWRWVVYDVIDEALAMSLLGRGVDLIETRAIGELRASLHSIGQGNAPV